tara:strand:- start:614 stop:1423 length:810 start_codon:yes stop_codon:yes gene_type:complete
MFKPKIFDCITFFDENLLTNTRFEILKDVVDFFIVVESNFDHKGNKKEINFKLENLKFKHKVRHIVLEENFPKNLTGWEIEAFQREKINLGLSDASYNDLVMFSDSDEIPDPNSITRLDLKKKYAIFLQKFFVYKINIFNQYETPWEGTRICKKKDLKSFTHLRKEIRLKNLNKSFWNFKYEKSIQIIDKGGWHFNNLYNVATISRKLKTFQHTKFKDDRYSAKEIIKNKILNLEDLFERNQKYEKVSINQDYPEYIRNNLNIFKDHII